MAISYVGAGTGVSSQASPTVPLPAGLTTDDGNGIADLLVLVIETANQATTISNSGGGTWNQVSGSPQGTGTAGGTTATGCQVWTSRYNGTQTDPTLADAGDHIGARMYAYRGVDPTSPINASGGAVESASDTSLSAPGVTTTVTDCWVLHALALMDDGPNFGATFTNANLTGITDRGTFGHAQGNDGRLTLVDGVKATAGASGNTTNTLTASSTKAFVTLALAPAPVTPTTTITPTVVALDAVAVTPTPGQVTTTIAPPVLTLTAVELTGGAGPGSLIATPTTLRFDPVAVTPTPGQVTTSATPATLGLEPGQIVVPLTEGFGKADGTGLGPDRTWTRRVYLQATEWETVSGQARFGITSPAGATTDHTDLQVPAPNIDGVPNQQATLTVPAVTQPSISEGYGLLVSLFVRFALTAGDTNLRGYAAQLWWNDIPLPPSNIPAPGLWLALWRYDATDQMALLSVDGIGAGDVGLPGTLTVRADDDQISATFTHSGLFDLAAAATDTTYADGGIALAGQIDITAGDTGHVTVDDLYAYTAPDEPAVVELRLIPPLALTDGHRLRLTAVPLVFINQIDAQDQASPPVDIYDAGDQASPPTDLNDPEHGLAEFPPQTITLEAVPLAPFGEGPGQTPITAPTLELAAVPVTPTPGQVTTTLTPAALALDPVPVSPLGEGPGAGTITPTTVRLDPVPVTPTPGQVTTTITPTTIHLAAIGPIGPVTHVPPPIPVTRTSPGNTITRVDHDYRISVNGQDSLVAVVSPDNRIEVQSG